MKPISTDSGVMNIRLHTKQEGSARVVILVLICAAIAGAAVWHYQSKKSADVASQKPEKPMVDLSDSSKAVLGRLRSTVEMRFYSVLDPASVPESDRNFAARVDELLAAYERNGNGKVLVSRHNSLS